MRIAGVELRDPRDVAGGHVCRSFAAELAAGTDTRVFAKTLTPAPPGLFAAEAAGLHHLAVEGGPPLPGVLAVGDDGIVLEWVEPAVPTAGAASRFGRALATMHRGGDGRYGAEFPGFIATVALDNTSAEDWPSFFARRRLEPALHQADRLGVLDPDDRDAVAGVIARLGDLAGPAEPPARIHGDLWSGNLLWAADGNVWLVDAGAAHGGHRETDLAMLMLFGAPLLAEILSAYDEVYPRAAGWQSRLALHQLYPLLVHAVLFGGSYGARVGAAARDALR